MVEEAKMVNLRIDGQEIQVEEGTTVLEATKKLSINIPTLCYHEALTPYGSCRLCCVEVTQGNRTSIKASCLLKAQDDMVVRTDTKRIVKGRKIMAELLLARCPDSEKLQKIARDLGVTETRIKPKIEDCILCGLCVRMCHERMGIGAIGFVNRGSDRKVKPPFERHSDICQTCGACAFICPTNAVKLEEITTNEPVPLPDEFDMGLRPRSVMHIPYPQAVPKWAVIDKEHCIHFLKDACGVCMEFCEAGAIDYEQKEQELDLNAGSIILAPGTETFNASLKKEYGYGIFPNVVSSIEFERILSASGPFEGHVIRPSDKETPRKIAFIQCVGSREQSPGNPYCSSVCCMYAIKEAIIAQEHVKGLKSFIFNMDIRAFGKEFDDYYNRARDEHHIEFIRARPANIEENPSSKNLVINYMDGGELKHEEFDMIVLSVGLEVPEDVVELGGRLGIDMNKYNFAETDIFSPLSTSRNGVFVCGAFSSPKDIPDSVVEASGAAAKASSIIASERGSLITVPEYPPERQVGFERPKIGVFICHCGINIGGIVDVPSVVEYAKTLPFVSFVEHNIYTCSQDTQEHIKEKIDEHDLNRIVVAACTPRTHEPLFQNTMREVGLNPYLFEMANIRDQCSWVHMQEPEKATEKAKDLVRMAVSKAKWLEPLKKSTLAINRNVLIVGGGVAGMSAALGFAEQGYDSCLIEKEKELGGNLRHIYHTISGEDPQKELKDIIQRVEDNERIRVFKGARLVDVEGYVGNFKSKILQGADEKEIEHGVVIVATGAKEYKPSEYQYGKDERILTQLELEERLEKGNLTLRNVVMIQCVGSRGEFVPYCSRICCTTAIKNALKIKATNPDTDIYVLYRDIRTYGFKEDLYQKACENGIRFIRFEEDEKPVVALQGGEIKVSIKELLLGEEIELNPDLLVLSSAILPRPDNDELSRFLKVPLSKDDFFLEAHMKLRPVDFATSGIFLCGMAHSPKFIDESISQAYAAVSRACIILSKERLESEGLVSVIDQEKCNQCEACVQLCPYNAIESDDEGEVMINELLCESCGACAGACKGGAIQQRGFNDYQIISMVKSAFEEDG